ncbi:MAG TPA: hypothetical protein DDW50_04880 [Firmicutes bacterium]|nr:hypothetical protein [Bacillota bacterium]
MSKIIKSEQLVETHPRQLPPVDVDSFFILDEQERRALLGEDIPNNLNSVENTGNPSIINEVSSPTADQEEIFLDKTVTDDTSEPPAAKEEDSPENDDDNIAITISQADRKRLESVLLDFEDKPKPRPKPQLKNEKKWFPPTTAKQGVETKGGTEDINLDHIADIAATLESLLSGTKEQPSIHEEKAGPAMETTVSRGVFQRDIKNFSGTEKSVDKPSLFGIKPKSVLNEVDQKADTVVRDAKDQADLVLEGARQTAAKSIETAKQQAETVIADAHRQADGIIEEANQKVTGKLEEANQQTAVIKEEAHQQGLATGREAAVVAVKQELTENLDRALALINEIETEREERIGTSEPELLKLAVAIAEKIIGQEIELDKDRQIQIVREALIKASTANMITIRIHSDDLQLLRENQVFLQSAFNEPKRIDFKEDCSIPAGNCFIETDQGNLDARVKSQLERVMTELLKVGKIQ